MFNYKFYNLLGLIGITCLLVSCLDNEPIDFPREKPSANAFDLAITEDGIHSARNSNPYDYTGQVFYEVLDEFISVNSGYDSIHLVYQEITEILNGLPQPILPVYGSVSTIQKLLDDPVGMTDSLLSDSGLSLNTRSDINDYLSVVADYNIENFDDIMDYNLSFEESVLANFTLSPKEKEVMLTLASIFRYYCLYSKGRDDRDWDVSVGNRAVLVGALQNTDSAISIGLIAGLCAQLGITD